MTDKPTDAEMISLMDLMVEQTKNCNIESGSEAEKTLQTIIAIRDRLASLTPMNDQAAFICKCGTKYKFAVDCCPICKTKPQSTQQPTNAQEIGETCADQSSNAQTTNAWQQMLHAQAEIGGYQGGDEHRCSEHGHVFENGKCVACEETEDDENWIEPTDMGAQ